MLLCHAVRSMSMMTERSRSFMWQLRMHFASVPVALGTSWRSRGFDANRGEQGMFRWPLYGLTTAMNFSMRRWNILRLQVLVLGSSMAQGRVKEIQPVLKFVSFVSHVGAVTATIQHYST